MSENETYTPVEFVKEGSHFYYYDEDGNKLTGLQKINGFYYLFGTVDGALKTEWQTPNGIRYYYSTEDGNPVFGIVKWHGRFYYVDEQEGKIVNKTIIIDGLDYTFDENGILTNDVDVNVKDKLPTLESLGLLHLYAEETYMKKSDNVGVTYPDSVHGEIFNDYEDNVASGQYSSALGAMTNATGDFSSAKGNMTTASGAAAEASGVNSVAAGLASNANNSSAASGDYSSSYGYYTVADSENQFALGKFNVIDSENKYAFIIGNGENDSNRSNAFAVDWNGNINAGGDVVATDSDGNVVSLLNLNIKSSPFKWWSDEDGNRKGIIAIDPYKQQIASGDSSFSMGYTAIASGNFSFTFGLDVYAKGTYSIAMGHQSDANDFASIALGDCSKATGSGALALAGAEANGQYSIAIGRGGRTSHSGSLAISFDANSPAKASNTGSMALGIGTTASGKYSSSIGHSTTASGSNSLAMGYASVADGEQSIAIGGSCTSTGDYSATLGFGLEALGRMQTVVGSQNIPDDNNKYVFIVGNGNGISSNGLTVDWNGNVIAGRDVAATDSDGNVVSLLKMQSAITVYVNAVSGSDSNDGSTTDTAFSTLSKALSVVSYYRSATINLATGMYSIPDKDITLICSYISLIGNSASDTVIKGNISLENSYLKLSNVTLDCTDAAYANTSATAPLRILSGSKIYLENAVISTVTQYCISATTSSNVYCFKTSFSGCTSYAVLLTGDASATIYRCTDESGNGLQSSYGCRAYLISSPDFSYSNGYFGMVYVDGQQVLPQTAETAAVLSMGGNV